MNRNTIIMGILGIALVAVGIFAFLQTQSLTELQETSTQVSSDLRSEGTQFAGESAGTATQSADNAIATGTQLADEAIATGTQLADEAIATGTQQADFAIETATSVAATTNALQDSANATSTQAADTIAEQSAQGTDTADNLATQQFELTVAAIVYSEAQSTLEAQSASAIGTLEASGFIGDGLLSAESMIQDGFTQFEGAGFVIALPDTYVGGDIADSNTDDLEDALDDFNLDDTLDTLSAQEVIFFAIDTTDLGGLPRATVSLNIEQSELENATLTEYIASAYFGIAGDFALITSDIVPINGQATGRVIIDQTLDNGVVRQLQYIYTTNDNNFYVLTFTVPMFEYANIRTDLEAIATTLRITE